MLQTLIDYFAAEKAEALLFIFVGNAALIVSFSLWKLRSPLRGMIAPLVAVAAIQLVVGGTVFLRTDAQVETLKAQLATSPAEFKAAETARMETVMRNFGLYKQIEIGLLAIGAVLVRTRRTGDRWHGVGLGLLIQSALMLVLDLFAEARAETYIAALRALA
jgi:hypothetical protein